MGLPSTFGKQRRRAKADRSMRIDGRSEEPSKSRRRRQGTSHKNSSPPADGWYYIDPHGNAQGPWTQDPKNLGNLPVITNEVYRTEFPIAAILKKYPLQVVDFLFNTGDLKSQCANEQTPATLKYRDITAAQPTNWALNYWCRPMNNERVPLEVTLVLKDFAPVKFQFLKEVE